MASFLYNTCNFALHVFQIKRFLGKSDSDFDKIVANFEKRQHIKNTSRKLKKKYEYHEKQLGGQPCYCFRPKDKKIERAVLLLFGGGYLIPPSKGDFSLAGELAEHTRAEVYLPIYPLAPKYKLIDIASSVIDVYREMLQHYESQKIIFMGSSSGAAFCLTLCLYIRHEKLILPFPGRMIMLSPGLQMPPNEVQINRMKEQESKDVVIPITFCKNIHCILVDESSSYLLRAFDTSWRGMPQMDIFYGDQELFYAYIPDIYEAVKEGNVRVNIHIGKNMMHCWPMLGFTKEGKKTRADIYKIIESI